MGTVESGISQDGTSVESRGKLAVRHPRVRETARYDWTEDEPRAQEGPNEQLANFLGWFSVGLGVSQIIMPRVVSRICGVENENSTLMRSIGIREITSGVGILTQRKPTNWLWTRVAGDLMDLAMLGKTMSNGENKRGRTTFATAAVLGVLALDVLSAQQLASSPNTAPESDGETGIHVRKSITVNRTPDEVYAFWHDFENLPRFMRHLESVRVTGPGRSHWKAKAAGGKAVEWDAVSTRDEPNELIAWRSLGDADVYNEGEVRFRAAPGGRGTEIHVDLRYEPPGGVVGVIGSKIAKLFRSEPGQEVKDDLLAFKQVMEIGEVMLSDATVRRGMPHPAQPDR